MNAQELAVLVASGESLAIEFKSDRGPLPDAELVEAVCCLANGQGGTLLIGVEDDGRITGLHARHQTAAQALAALIANRTVPPIMVSSEFVMIDGVNVAVVTVPASSQPISTSDGRLLTRYLDMRGAPGCRPLYAHELTSWRADRMLVDPSALPVPGTSWDDLDSLEFNRVRRMVTENRGDNALLELTDEEIARALGLI